MGVGPFPNDPFLAGASSLTQGTLAARPAPSPNALYFATDTGELWIANAAGNAWQSIAATSAATFTAALTNNGGLGFTRMGDSQNGDAAFYLRGTNAWITAATLGFGFVNGGVDVQTAGQGLAVKEGANCKQGVATLAAGTVTVANTTVTANSRIFITPQEGGTLTGVLRVSARVVGTSFTVSSSIGTDTVTFAWEIFEPG